MLPFIRKKRAQQEAIQVHTTPQGLRETPMAEGGEVSQDLVSAADDLISAVKRGDAQAVAECFADMFDILEMEPHEEFEHEGDLE